MKDGSSVNNGIKKILFQTGFIKSVKDKSACIEHVFTGGGIPQKAENIFNKDKIAELSGKWGSPGLATPIQYHMAEVELKDGSIYKYEVFNIAVMLFTANDERNTRLFRFLVQLDEKVKTAQNAKSPALPVIVRNNQISGVAVAGQAGERALSKHKPGNAWLFSRFDVHIQDKPADVCFLMDIGSRFLFGHLIAQNEIPLLAELEQLMQNARDKQGSWPDILYCSENDPAQVLLGQTVKQKGIVFESAPGSAFYELTDPLIESFNKFAGGSQTESNSGGYADATEDEIIMARSLIPDTYDPCPCASGKKFKFCCKPVFREIIEAMDSAENGDIKAALEYMDKAAAKAGETPEILCRYSIVHSFSDMAKSLEYLDKALALNPNHPRANYILGISLKEKGDYNAALEAYFKAARNYPPGDRFHLNEVWNNIGTAYYHLGNYAGARDAWEKALYYMPRDKMARDNLKLLNT